MRPTRNGPRSGPTGKRRRPVSAGCPPYQAVPTPNKRTIREVCEFLKVDETTSAKLLVYLADGKPVAAPVRGDHELNEAKFRRVIGAAVLVPADAATIEKATGAPMGFLGPVGIKIPLVIDRAIAAMATVVVGGNAVDVHLKGVVPGRDFPLENVHDVRNADAGDPCPRCGKPLQITAGLEIGHVFKLGTKYSKSMGATYLDEKGQEVHAIMGCYGIGINRIVAGAVEAGPRFQRHPLAAGAGSLSRCGGPASGSECGGHGACARAREGDHGGRASMFWSTTATSGPA